MRALFTALLVGVSLMGCARQQESEAMDVASSAHEAAAKANRALDDGVASGTTMGNEIEELQNRLDAVEQENRQLRADVDELEHEVRSLKIQSY
ncbi:TPA: hypothetical protein UMZ03_000168 [Stenotrophomonas maltophilia]|uniref:Uncharacterized protein n=1 Tax=Stenotrophomonas geniculata TaxID=86188 RepID=A0ABW1MXB7_9GAMM|nr:hypothetical protein [Stenotrophomonas maltophilia]MDT3473896.1 hypothetical protein [Stenotrophomonas maltophilia]HEL3849504.1 hypothetical protein [Stenotrophomonas maltophilia]